jgi:hypothetical protein
MVQQDLFGDRREYGDRGERPAEPVLMALHAEYYELIWRGLKTHEFRRRFLEGPPGSLVRLPDITVSRFRDVGPLVELGRLEEAERLLAECQRVFEDHADMTLLARVFNARAGLEAAFGHGRAAADLGRTALRMFYARPEPEDIAIGHYDLAVFLGTLGGDRAGQRAHWLAGALIFRLTGMDHYLKDTVRGLADELRKDGDAEGLPSTVAQVVAVAEQTEGVRLGVLLKTLQPAPQALEEGLAEILREAASATDPSTGEPG